MSPRLFAYGTLCEPATLSRFVSGLAPGEPAILRGYACHRVRGADYPGVVARSGAETRGLLYCDISADALARLDAYEGALYQREALPITRRDGSVVEAFVYVVPPERSRALGTEAWPPPGV